MTLPVSHISVETPPRGMPNRESAACGERPTARPGSFLSACSEAGCGVAPRISPKRLRRDATSCKIQLVVNEQDDQDHVRRRRSRAGGWVAFLAIWALCDPILIIIKLLLLEMVSGAGPDAKNPMVGYTRDGWWICLIIACVVGVVAYANIDSELDQARDVRGNPAKATGSTYLSWRSTVGVPVLCGVLAYLLVWFFHEPIGLIL